MQSYAHEVSGILIDAFQMRQLNMTSNVMDPSVTSIKFWVSTKDTTDSCKTVMVYADLNSSNGLDVVLDAFVAFMLRISTVRFSHFMDTLKTEVIKLRSAMANEDLEVNAGTFLHTKDYGAVYIEPRMHNVDKRVLMSFSVGAPMAAILSSVYENIVTTADSANVTLVPPPTYH